VWHGSVRVENAGGAWQEQPHLTLEFADGSASAHTTAFIGEGGYEGLTALTEFDYTTAGHFALRGIIVEAPAPEPPVLQPAAKATLAGDD
jgi:hypothetical protein